MNDDRPTARRSVQVINPKGVHMRPSSKFVKLASTFQSELWVSCQGKRVYGKSILDMTTLAAECGQTLELEAQGPDTEQALDALVELVAAGFHMGDDNN